MYQSLAEYCIVQGTSNILLYFTKTKNPRNLLATFISLEVHLAAYLLQPAKQSSGHGNVKVNSTKRNEIA